MDSAQRINAGILFEQEKTATLPEPEKPAAPAAQPQTPKAEQPLVKPLQTYQGDIESLVGEKQVSVVSIAAAEADKREAQPAQQAAEGRPWVKKALIVAAGVALLAAAGGIGLYIYSALQPVPLSQQAPAPFISVDETRTVAIQPTDQRQQIMEALMAAKHDVSLSLGLVARIQVAKPAPIGDGTLSEVAAPEFMQALAPSMPLSLVRTLEPQMLLGIHSFDENQAFMILKADSYETAYSGLLAWEDTMYEDMVPLFARTPAVRAVPPAPVPPPINVATSTATSSGQASTSAQAAATTSQPALPSAPVQFLQSTFVDQIVENRDARVMLNQDGDILLLWTMLDRSTIVITTNQATLREIISRLSQASILSLPAAN